MTRWWAMPGKVLGIREGALGGSEWTGTGGGQSRAGVCRECGSESHTTCLPHTGRYHTWTAAGLAVTGLEHCGCS